MLKIMHGWRYNAQIMPDLNDTSTPPAIGLYLLINTPSLSFLKEMLHNNYSVKHLMSKRKIGNCEALKGLLYVFLLMNLHLMSQKLTAWKTHWVRVEGIKFL